jgi:hypothetical protein
MVSPALIPALAALPDADCGVCKNTGINTCMCRDCGADALYDCKTMARAPPRPHLDHNATVGRVALRQGQTQRLVHIHLRPLPCMSKPMSW